MCVDHVTSQRCFPEGSLPTTLAPACWGGSARGPTGGFPGIWTQSVETSGVWCLGRPLWSWLGSGTSAEKDSSGHQEGGREGDGEHQGWAVECPRSMAILLGVQTLPLMLWCLGL